MAAHRTLLLDAMHRAGGARFTAADQWCLPADYGAPADEERVLYEGAGLVDRSDDDVIVVTGVDRLTFLQGMLTNDVAGLTAGQGCRAAWLNVKARVQVLTTVLAFEDRLLMVVPAGWGERFSKTLDRYVITEDVVFAVEPQSHAALNLDGPRVPHLLAALTGLTVSELVEMTRAPGSLNHHNVTIAGQPARLIGWAGAPAGGCRLRVEPEAAPAIVEALLNRGGMLVGRTASEAARIAAGQLLFGHDVDTDTFLPEIPLSPLVSWTKGCFLGQEPVARVHHRGRANRAVVGLLLEPDAPLPNPRAPLRAGDTESRARPVGWVTSVSRSAVFGRPIALGFVRREYLEPGTVLGVELARGEAKAEVTSLPIETARAVKPSE